MIMQILQFARSFRGSSPKQMAVQYLNQMSPENMEQCKEIAAFLQQSFGDCPIGGAGSGSGSGFGGSWGGRKRSAWET